jgi:hypothetical protein
MATEVPGVVQVLFPVGGLPHSVVIVQWTLQPRKHLTHRLNFDSSSCSSWDKTTSSFSDAIAISGTSVSCTALPLCPLDPATLKSYELLLEFRF